MSEFSDCEKIMAKNEMCIILPMHSSRSKRLSCIEYFRTLTFLCHYSKNLRSEMWVRTFFDNALCLIYDLIVFPHVVRNFS